MKRNLMLGLLSSMAAIYPAQAQVLPVSSPPAFEVTSVKPSDPSVAKMGKGKLSGGRIDLPGFTVKDLMMFAYGVQDDMILGSPKWIDADRFDIVAKAPVQVPVETLRLMMQTLLADRFGLVIHSEAKAMPCYVLTAVKNPPSLHESSGGQSQCMWQELGNGLRRRECHSLTLAEFTKQLPGTGGIGVDLPVVDQTGLKGNYDFQFDVGTVQRRVGGEAAGGSDSSPAPIDTDSGPTIFGALLKIGLKLERRKMPMPVIVIDQAQRPVGN